MINKDLAKQMMRERAARTRTQPAPAPPQLPPEAQLLDSWPQPQKKQRKREVVPEILIHEPEIPELQPTKVALKKTYGSTQTFSLTWEERQALHRFARERGLNLSSWLRFLVREAMRKELGEDG